MSSLMSSVDEIKDLAVVRNSSQESIAFIQGFLNNEEPVPITHAKIKGYK